jgi:RNA polymerase sigma-70 factor (ECF subfamily)
MPSIVIDKGRSATSKRRAVTRAFERPTRTPDLDAGLDVRAALRELPPREQVCIVLRFFDDLTVPQVAARLGLAEGTVKRYLADARARLLPLLDVTEWDDEQETTTVFSIKRGD